MRKIQFKVNKEKRAAALYIKGKLFPLSVPKDWHYFYLGGYRVDKDETFITFLNAMACETEEELLEFEPLLNPFSMSFRNCVEWEQVIEKLHKRIDDSDFGSLHASYRSVEVVYKHKLSMFVKDDEGIFCADGHKISDSSQTFKNICRAAMCETEQELELFAPALDELDNDWRNKAKIVHSSIIDAIY